MNPTVIAAAVFASFVAFLIGVPLRLGRSPACWASMRSCPSGAATFTSCSAR